MLRTVVKVGIHILLVIASCGLSAAAEQKANPNSCNLDETDAIGLSGDLGVDISALSNFTDTVARILKEGKFAELDCLADHARSGKERLPGGLWKIHLLYQGLREPVPYPVHATQEDWTDLLKRLRRWVKARPQSITARVALALAYVEYAHDARALVTRIQLATPDGSYLGNAPLKPSEFSTKLRRSPPNVPNGTSLCKL